MFSKILIANRGEIAVRIIRACKEMGIASATVYSEADRRALHTALADESYCIGPADPIQSYLSEERIISAACACGAQAIHPGYGFLSENPHFAKLCRQNGIAFIGPDADLMEALASKSEIKKRMTEAGLRCIPGTQALSGIDEALKAADKIGYPVMLKAVSGGGGKGIRPIRSASEMASSFRQASAESEKSFGDPSLYLEKLITPARHVEMQILADEDGNVICLGERDCSIQTHHQKLIEEAPCPAMNSGVRASLIRDVAYAVKKLGYTGVGTLEFLLDSAGVPWFMEMNLRLQVEHTVTEALTNIDLVKWQIRTAAGKNISFGQKDVTLNGSAIECRINALSPGTVTSLHVPGGPFVRFDTYLTVGCE
ncbi:MAG: ATP-grasp domain-containing protein, partial [Clostridiales bacterium]|nr:ATP-grasp domain-containing protein [Clostridiales bacterium]